MADMIHLQAALQQLHEAEQHAKHAWLDYVTDTIREAHPTAASMTVDSEWMPAEDGTYLSVSLRHFTLADGTQIDEDNADDSWDDIEEAIRAFPLEWDQEIAADAETTFDFLEV